MKNLSNFRKTVETSVDPHLQSRSFPSSPGPLYQNEVKCSAFDMEMLFILMQINLIFTRKVVHLASFWKWGFLELGSGLFTSAVFLLQTTSLIGIFRPQKES